MIDDNELYEIQQSRSHPNLDDTDLLCTEQLDAANFKPSPSVKGSYSSEGFSELLLLYAEESLQSTVCNNVVNREKAKTKRKLF